MRLSDLLSEHTITINLMGPDKESIIRELLRLAMKTGKINDEDKALKAVLDREKLMSTGLEKGVAVPHAKTKAADDITMALGISREGMEFQSADGKQSHLFFFLLAPEAAAGPNIKVLAQIARLTSDFDFCKALKDAETPQKVLEIIRGYE